MSQLHQFAQDAAFGAADDPLDGTAATAGTGDAPDAAFPLSSAQQAPLIVRLAETSGIYAIVLVTIFGLANALGLF